MRPSPKHNTLLSNPLKSSPFDCVSASPLSLSLSLCGIHPANRRFQQKVVRISRRERREREKEKEIVKSRVSATSSSSSALSSSVRPEFSPENFFVGKWNFSPPSSSFSLSVLREGESFRCFHYLLFGKKGRISPGFSSLSLSSLSSRHQRSSCLFFIILRLRETSK